MDTSRRRQYIQLSLFPDWQRAPRRYPTVTEVQSAGDDKQSFAERHHRFVQGWRAHEYQLRLFSGEE